MEKIHFALLYFVGFLKGLLDAILQFTTGFLIFAILIGWDSIGIYFPVLENLDSVPTMLVLFWVATILFSIPIYTILAFFEVYFPDYKVRDRFLIHIKEVTSIVIMSVGLIYLVYRLFTSKNENVLLAILGILSFLLVYRIVKSVCASIDFWWIRKLNAVFVNTYSIKQFKRIYEESPERLKKFVKQDRVLNNKFDGSKEQMYEVYFKPHDTLFISAEKIENWIDSSFSNNLHSIGSFRLPSVDNGNYESRHPVLNKNGDIKGYISDASNDLGFTYACVYTGDYFWVVHHTKYNVRKGLGSNVSLVGQIGEFPSSFDLKFKVIDFFEFGRHWVDTIKAFKLLDERRKLLYLTNSGFCLFDTNRCNVISRTNFNDVATNILKFNLSPNLTFLALVIAKRDGVNSPENKEQYDNFVRIYDLKTGLLIDDLLIGLSDQTAFKSQNEVEVINNSEREKIIHDQKLPLPSHKFWHDFFNRSDFADETLGNRTISTRLKIDFSEDSRYLKVSSGSSTLIFELSPRILKIDAVM